jgi:lipoprotein-anchoring transpeptidase ErfK/SrfK
MRGRLRLLSWVPLIALTAGCGATAHPAARTQPGARGHSAAHRDSPTQHAAAPRCRTGAIRRIGSAHLSVAAVVRTHARAYRRPGRSALASFGRLNQNGFPTVFRVLASVRSGDCRTAWYRVQLPIRPNGTTGYVRAREVAVGQVPTRIGVDLTARRLTFFRNGRRVLNATVAVGAPATPTPIGRYYVNQKLIPADPSGPFGPGALGISAFSPVLTGWTQGGPVAIHGTNEPWSIGHAVSNGCIRVRNPVLRRLFGATPAGTPVVVHR